MRCVQESYAMLGKHDLPVLKDEMERVDTLRYSWQKMCVLASEVSSHLIQVSHVVTRDLASS